MNAPDHRFGFHLALAVLLTIGATQIAFAKDYLIIDSSPSGANVEIDGLVVGKTPYKVEVPGGYLHGTKSVFGKVLRQQMHLRLQMDGYLPLDTDLARGPMPWIALNGTYHGDYWLLKTANFSFKLNKAATAFTGSVQMTAATETASLRPVLATEDIVRMTSPAVLFLRGSDGTGSGFLVTATGVAVTNAHVVNGQSLLTASTPNGQTFNASVQYVDPDLDLALLKLEGSNFAYLTVADLSTIQTGSSVIAIGNPSGGLQNTVTKGIASAIGPMSSDPGIWIQTDTAINPGNSGGPLLNSAGEVVGITTQKRFLSSDGRPLQGIGFALSSQDLLSVLSRFYPSIEDHHQLPVNSQSGTGSIFISSDAEGADIFVDEKFIGNTPSTLTLPEGPHNVRVESPNRVAWSRQVTLLKNSSVNLKATLMAASPNTPSTLFTTAAPASTAPSIPLPAQRDSALQALADPASHPQEIKLTQSDKAVAPVSAPSKLGNSDSVPSRPETNNSSSNWAIREVNSSGRIAKVAVNSFPSGAQVFVDSAGVGQTPCTIASSPGEHALQIVLPGYRDQIGKIKVNQGTDLVVDVNMNDK
jgi:serine protease Do